VKRRSSDTRSEEEKELRYDDRELGFEKIAKHEKSEEMGIEEVAICEHVMSEEEK
jgi:hypothetical protein